MHTEKQHWSNNGWKFKPEQQWSSNEWTVTGNTKVKQKRITSEGKVKQKWCTGERKCTSEANVKHYIYIYIIYTYIIYSVSRLLHFYISVRLCITFVSLFLRSWFVFASLLYFQLPFIRCCFIVAQLWISIRCCFNVASPCAFPFTYSLFLFLTVCYKSSLQASPPTPHALPESYLKFFMILRLQGRNQRCIQDLPALDYRKTHEHRPAILLSIEVEAIASADLLFHFVQGGGQQLRFIVAIMIFHSFWRAGGNTSLSGVRLPPAFATALAHLLLLSLRHSRRACGHLTRACGHLTGKLCTIFQRRPLIQNEYVLLVACWETKTHR